jgi:hypothetical protein
MYTSTVLLIFIDQSVFAFKTLNSMIVFSEKITSHHIITMRRVILYLPTGPTLDVHAWEI